MRSPSSWKVGAPRVRFAGRTSEDRGDRSLSFYPRPDGRTYVEQANPAETSGPKIYVDTTELLSLAQQEVRRGGGRGPDYLTQNIRAETTGQNPATLIVKRT